MNARQKQQRVNKISEQNLALRNKLWPQIKDDDLWNRHKKKGFTTIPRPMPLVFRVMDGLSNGKPLSSTYFVLWCRVWDNGFIKIDSPKKLAYEAGFSGQRCESTWAGRMKILKEIGFINAEPGAFGDFQYVILPNPFKVIKKLYENNKVQKSLYFQLVERMQEIGADDLD